MYVSGHAGAVGVDGVTAVVGHGRGRYADGVGRVPLGRAPARNDSFASRSIVLRSIRVANSSGRCGADQASAQSCVESLPLGARGPTRVRRRLESSAGCIRREVVDKRLTHLQCCAADWFGNIDTAPRRSTSQGIIVGKGSAKDGLY
jgi:hypothetical protein